MSFNTTTTFSAMRDRMVAVNPPSSAAGWDAEDDDEDDDSDKSSSFVVAFRSVPYSKFGSTSN